MNPCYSPLTVYRVSIEAFNKALTLSDGVPWRTPRPLWAIVPRSFGDLRLTPKGGPKWEIGRSLSDRSEDLSQLLSQLHHLERGDRGLVLGQVAEGVFSEGDASQETGEHRSFSP